MGSSADRLPFFAALRSATRFRDCLLLAAVPALLVGVFCLPETTKRSLTFSYTDPTLLTAYTANFVHFRVEHLAANVAGYILLAGTGYALAVLAGRRRLFGVAGTTYLLAFPVVLSALNLAVPRDAYTYGFSGVVMAFAGLLPLLLVLYAQEQLDPHVRVRYTPGLFFATLAVITVVALPHTTLTFAIAGAATFMVGVYGLSIRSDRHRGVTFRTRLRERPGYGDAFILGLGLILGYPFVGFPTTSWLDSTIVNLYAHFVGYCLAFIVPYLALELGVFERTGSRSNDG
ncbi:hypothetical protein [Halospeciosus flavus]|uniref:Peptidase S54 rhomboid domain-containing protein n=1 Tax=Halospeciosus flavus TaxID=3032283 RepID=A0ABD5Z1W0_9EURY|nr:hypothetical protein [Halospeciosus flavus]